MAAQIIPIICTKQQVYDFCNISAAQAAANLGNGVTPLNAYIQALMDRTATEICKIIGYDYTASQNQTLRFFGNGDLYMRTDFPNNTFLTFKSWDPDNPTAAPVNIGSTALSVVTIDPWVIYRNDGGYFEENLEYRIEAVQAADPDIYGGWPQGIVQIQVEAIAELYKNSWNLTANFDMIQDGGSEFHVTKFRDMVARLKEQLRPYRAYAA